MKELEKMIRTPVSALTMLITEVILLTAAFWFFNIDKTIEALLVLVVVEIRHLRYVTHKKDISGE